MQKEQFPSHFHKTKPGWRVINILRKTQKAALRNSAQIMLHLPSPLLFPSWIFPLAIAFKQYQDPHTPSPCHSAGLPCYWSTRLCTWHSHSIALGSIWSHVCLSAAPGQKYKRTQLTAMKLAIGNWGHLMKKRKEILLEVTKPQPIPLKPCTIY